MLCCFAAEIERIDSLIREKQIWMTVRMQKKSTHRAIIPRGVRMMVFD
jgi:hypothetical protein